MEASKILLAIFGLFIGVTTIDGCNEAVCASRVSFCLLENFCNCDYKNCTCCKTCSNCLGDKFLECCSCVDVCPTLTEGHLTQSSVATFSDSYPELFKLLTEGPAPLNMWKAFTFPVIYNKAQFMYSAKNDDTQLENANADGKPTLNLTCTVAFMAECMSERRCRKSCMPLGASAIRWFHNGCCECIGDTCINYGLAEPKCLNCSSFDDDSLDEDDTLHEDNEDNYYYEDLPEE